jgi:hypothetical protein
LTGCLPSAQVRAKKGAQNSRAKKQQATFLQKPISKKKERVDRKRLERVRLRCDATVLPAALPARS